VRQHEGEAERAIRAGLEIVDALSKLDVPDAGHLAVRIGIATELVVVSSTSYDREWPARGWSCRIAAGPSVQRRGNGEALFLLRVRGHGAAAAARSHAWHSKP